MYKLLLCWRYLRTRYIALASVVSVTLGVATLIVVNSVMEGFTSEMQNRIHGILSDVVLQTRNFSGEPDAQRHMDLIRQTVGEDIEAMTPTVVVPAILRFAVNGQEINRPVKLIGIDAARQARVSDYRKYLQHPENRKEPNFLLHEDGYDDRDHQGGADAPERPQMAGAGWRHRRRVARLRQIQSGYRKSLPPVAPVQRQSYEEHTSGIDVRSAFTDPSAISLQAIPARADSSISPDAKGEPAERSSNLWEPIAGTPPEGETAPSEDPFRNLYEDEPFDMSKRPHTGVVLGIATAMIRRLKDENDPTGGAVDHFMLLPGDDVLLWIPTVGTPPKAVSAPFTIVDFYESKMSEFDEEFAFVPIRALQEMRGMIDPQTSLGRFNAIQIRVKPGVCDEAVRDKLRAAFPAELYVVETWRDKQGALLAAVQMETAILNVLLFLIITVAGFGILAIFFMIVVEKTRDIGILKSLGASGRGVMGIFLSYGLLLGAVGAGMGLALGLLFVRYINEIADFLGWITGRPVFDPTIYYFYKIPTIIEPQTVTWIVLGAVGIAVLASILPARRAARLHPVEALRYE